MKYKISDRVIIVKAEGSTIGKAHIPLRDPHPEHIGKKGVIFAIDKEDRMPHIRLDDGTELEGSECWWQKEMKIDRILSDEERAKVWSSYYSGGDVDIEKVSYDEYMCQAQRDLTLKLVTERLKALAWILKDDDVKVGGPGSEFESREGS